MRGFGASPPPTAGFRHIDDLADLMAHLEIPRAALVGNSFGGRLALEMAWASPESVSRLALLAPSFPGWDWSSVVRDYGAAEEAALDAGDLDAAVRLNLDMWVRGPARPWSAELRSLADQLAGPMRVTLTNQRVTEELELEDRLPPLGDLSELRTPTLVGVGDRDVPDFVAIAERLAAAIPGARAVRFAGAGHLIPAERPDEVAEHLMRFLAPD